MAIGLVLLCLLCAFIAALVVVTRRRRRLDNDWEIDFDEVEIGPLLGAGGYGQVHKAMWKGTEVAVKMMASEKVTKDMEKSFKDEVRRTTLGRSVGRVDQLIDENGAGAGDDGLAASQRGALHGSVDQAAQDVHRHGIHGPRLPL